MKFKDYNEIFTISSDDEFNAYALKIFEFQYHNNIIYKKFCDGLKRTPATAKQITQIPFMPINFFKHHKIVCKSEEPEIVFCSSGTTGDGTSKHFVVDVDIYKKSFTEGFKYFYGNIEEYCILALLPSYMENKNSSLVYMAEHLINNTANADSGFYLNNIKELAEKISELNKRGQKILLLGVSFALLDMAKTFKADIPDIIIMETGGMKGRRKEIVRDELHEILRQSFGVRNIHSEYGMTELLSQAYSKAGGTFNCPPWMKVFVRGIYDPLEIMPVGANGAINVIDLANIYSCSFIATDDLGRVMPDNSFLVTGRLDISDIRGCNLLLS